MPGNIAFATYGDCDFDVYLHEECKRKGLQKPHYFDQWIDVKATYKVNMLYLDVCYDRSS